MRYSVRRCKSLKAERNSCRWNTQVDRTAANGNVSAELCSNPTCPQPELSLTVCCVRKQRVWEVTLSPRMLAKRLS